MKNHFLNLFTKAIHKVKLEGKGEPYYTITEVENICNEVWNRAVDDCVNTFRNHQEEFYGIEGHILKNKIT